MDLTGEASSGGRVLAARHITADQAVPEVNNAVNTSLLCYSMPFEPDFKSYLSALHIYAPVLWSCAALAVLSTFVLFALTLRSTYRRRPATLSNAVFVLAVYPVVATIGFIAIVVPRSRVVTEAVAQQAVMVGMYHLFCLLVKECGGVDQLIRCAEGARLETRVLPCCCWPCCIIPRPELHKSKILSLRFLVLQLPIIQAILYVIVLVLWSENVKLYLDSFIYIQPFIVTSILFGVWGMIMCVRAIEAAGFNPRGKFLALQFALLVVKLQGGMVKTLPDMITMPCLMVMHPSAFINLIHNCMMIVEMFLLSLWAYRLYSAPAAKFADKVQHAVVAVMEETPGAKRYGFEGIGNKSFSEAK